MVEFIAIIGGYGPAPLQRSPDNPAFPAYQLLLPMGEAGLATLIRQHLAEAPFMASDRFMAVGISATYALNLDANHAGFVLGEAERAYLARTTGCETYERAFHRSHEGVAA